MRRKVHAWQGRPIHWAFVMPYGKAGPIPHYGSLIYASTWIYVFPFLVPLSSCHGPRVVLGYLLYKFFFQLTKHVKFAYLRNYRSYVFALISIYVGLISSTMWTPICLLSGFFFWKIFFLLLSFWDGTNFGQNKNIFG